MECGLTCLHGRSPASFFHRKTPRLCSWHPATAWSKNKEIKFCWTNWIKIKFIKPPNYKPVRKPVTTIVICIVLPSCKQNISLISSLFPQCNTVVKFPPPWLYFHILILTRHSWVESSLQSAETGSKTQSKQLHVWRRWWCEAILSKVPWARLRRAPRWVWRRANGGRWGWSWWLGRWGGSLKLLLPLRTLCCLLVSIQSNLGGGHKVTVNVTGFTVKTSVFFKYLPETRAGRLSSAHWTWELSNPSQSAGPRCGAHIITCWLTVSLHRGDQVSVQVEVDVGEVRGRSPVHHHLVQDLTRRNVSDVSVHECQPHDVTWRCALCLLGRKNTNPVCNS